MGLIDWAQRWAWEVAAKRAALAVGKAAASYALAHSGLFQSWGLTASLDPNIVAGAALGGMHIAAHWLAFHFPKAFGWLDPQSPAPPADPPAQAV